jgi:hypothetical protein
MMAARRSSFSNVLGNLFLYVEPVILSGHGRKRRKDFTDCAQGSPHSLAPLTGKNPPYIGHCTGAIRAQLNGMMIAATMVSQINKSHTS